MNESTGRVKGISSFLKCAQQQDEYVDHNPSYIQKKVRKRPRKGTCTFSVSIIIIYRGRFYRLNFFKVTVRNQDRQNIIQN